MADIIKFRRRISRKKREAVEDKGFIVRDCREAFFMVDQEYMNGYAQLCKPVATSVYMILCRHVGAEQVCYPSNEYMANKVGVSEPTIRKAIKVLEDFGLIKVDRVNGQPNIYTLLHKSQWRRKGKFIRYGACGVNKAKGEELEGFKAINQEVLEDE